MAKRVDFDRNKAVELYKNGVSPTQIGRDLNVNYQTVINHLKKVGVYKVGNCSVIKLSLDNIPSINSSTKKAKLDDKKQKKKTSSKRVLHEVTMEEKIAYCNKKYGEGKWHFMSKKEFLDALVMSREKYLDEGGDF